MIRDFPRRIASTLAAASLVLTAPAFAGETVVPTNAETSETAPASGPALWSVADEDTTIYLFGTVHALPKEIQWLDDELSAVLASSDMIVTEVDMAEMAGPQMAKLVQETAVLPQGTTLRSLLTEEQTAIYESAMSQISLPGGAFDQFEPWYASMMMSMLPLLQQGYLPDAGAESVLLSKAGDMERGALETVAFQLGVFDGLPQEDQIEFLISTAENVGETKAMLDAMVAEWLEGDADGLAVLMNEGMEDPALADALLFQRNRNWVDWIDNRLKEHPGTVFMAVGAGHLAGEHSVQDYLEQRGFTVTRVR